MEVFIDKKFIDYLFAESLRRQNNVIVEIEQFLSNLAFVRIYSNISFEELKSSVVYRKFLNFGVLFPRFIDNLVPSIENGILIGDSNYKLFFIESYLADKKLTELGYINLNSKNINSELSLLFKKNEDGEIPISNNYRNDLLSWNFLSKYGHPVRSIIIMDRYMFKSVNRVMENIIPLLKQLLQKSEKIPVTIFFIGLFEDKKFPYPITEIFESVKTNLSKWNLANILFINSRNFHSRGVISSYWYINPDTSLDFIIDCKISRKSDGNIYHGFLFKPNKIRLVKEVFIKISKSLNSSSLTFYDGKKHGTLSKEYLKLIQDNIL